jgi:hypothetical protein
MEAREPLEIKTTTEGFKQTLIHSGTSGAASTLYEQRHFYESQSCQGSLLYLCW